MCRKVFAVLCNEIDWRTLQDEAGTESLGTSNKLPAEQDRIDWREY